MHCGNRFSEAATDPGKHALRHQLLVYQRSPDIIKLIKRNILVLLKTYLLGELFANSRVFPVITLSSIGLPKDDPLECQRDCQEDPQP